jgi:hypothetical protein
MVKESGVRNRESGLGKVSGLIPETALIPDTRFLIPSSDRNI